MSSLTIRRFSHWATAEWTKPKLRGLISSRFDIYSKNVWAAIFELTFGFQPPKDDEDDRWCTVYCGTTSNCTSAQTASTRIYKQFELHERWQTIILWYMKQFTWLSYNCIYFHCGWDQYKLSGVIYRLWCSAVHLRQRRLHSKGISVWYHKGL